MDAQNDESIYTRKVLWKIFFGKYNMDTNTIIIRFGWSTVDFAEVC
jgi:hypothetical protein